MLNKNSIMMIIFYHRVSMREFLLNRTESHNMKFYFYYKKKIYITVFFFFFFTAHPIEEEILSLNELKPIFDSLRGRGYVGIFLGELLSKLSRDKGPKWVADKWDQSGLQLSNIIDTELEKVDKIIKDYVSYC